MANNNKFLSFLGIAKKSGNLCLGMDAVKEGILKKKNIKLVLLTKDISESSEDKIKYISSKYNVKTETIDYLMEDIFSTLGKRSGIIGISNINFEKKMESMIQEEKMLKI